MLPSVGRKPGEPYLASWQMEPLTMAVLAGLTPPDVERVLHDDRLEPVPETIEADLAAITVETYTARRAYQIADALRRRGVPVVMGGYHATLVPDEVLEHADAVVLGEAEGVWPEVVETVRAGRPLEPTYRSTARPLLEGSRPDRSIYAGKRYLALRLVEATRGCRFACEFCSVQRFYAHSHVARPVDEVAAEVALQDARDVFLVDDNLLADPEHAARLAQALAPLGRRWVTQASLSGLEDEALVRALAQSGCIGLLVGFESLGAAALAAMGKAWNGGPERYRRALAVLRRHGIAVYGTFVFGYDGDDESSFAAAVDLAKRERFFLAAFNHLVPFPGTALYDRLEREGRLLRERWWLDPSYRFGDVAFRPLGMTAAALTERCMAARREFYSLRSMASRALDLEANCASARMAALFVSTNLMLRREVGARRGIELGGAG